MRKALIVGINDYQDAPLSSCVSDAEKINNILQKNFDLSPNFHCKLLTSAAETVNSALLKEQIDELLKDEVEVALFYFSGHGYLNNLGGYLVTQDAKKYDEGVSMTDVLGYIKDSKANEVIILLDCCFSGSFGEVKNLTESSILKEGVSIITSSRSSQVSYENHSGGIFTTIIYEALDGSSADTIGDVTIASVYNYADKILTPWDQRPIFKANLSKMISIRKCKPKVEVEVLRKIVEYFIEEDIEYSLDPSYEPTAEPRDDEKEKIFSHLQKFTAAGLVHPITEDHMYYAAINSKACKLTPVGKFYWKQVKNNKI